MGSALQLEGKRVVVTGAASGIGLATARQLASAGATLAILDWNGDALAAVAGELSTASSKGADSVQHYSVDVSDETQMDAAFASVIEAWGGIDILVHVAGIMREQMSDIRDITFESWQKVVAVNLSGAFLASRAVSRVMIPAGEGTIILVGSPAGVTGSSGSIPYGASKGGLNGLAMTLQRHLGAHGIRVHNFLPGSVETPLFTKSLAEGVKNGAPEQYAATAMASSVSPEGIGQAIALLASPLAASLQGNIFSR